MADHDNESAVSELSDHYLDTNPELAGADTPVINQYSGAFSFKHVVARGNIPITEAYQGALADLQGLNPDYYALPHGTRFINIKTASLDNVHFSIRNKVWSTLDKVSERIMKIWNARKDKQEKVLFIFAITGTGQYCGIAEMTGPWNKHQSIEGWNNDSHESVGSIPVMWVFVKNICYKKFDHLKIEQIETQQPQPGKGKNPQDKKDQIVTNMWNGMHIESALGREVVRIYVASPHISNILAWTAAQARDEDHKRIFKQAHREAQKQGQMVVYNRPNNHFGPGNINNYNPRHAPPGPQRNVMTSNNWRAGGNTLPQATGYGAAMIMPTQPAMPMQPVTPSTHGLPAFDGAGEIGSTPDTGKLLTCIVDDAGNFVPVDPSGVQTHAPIPNAGMGNQYYGQRFPQNSNSVENFQRPASQRGGYNRGGRVGVGGGGNRGGKTQIVHNHISYITNNIVSPVTSDINSTPRSIHHAASNASMTPSIMNDTSSARASKLQHAVSAAEFVPQSEANRSLRQNTLQAATLKHAASNATITNSQAGGSFITQADPHGPVTAPSITGMFNIAATNTANDETDKQSVDSYPSYMRGADSMAGYNPRPGPTQQATVPASYKKQVPQLQPPPTRVRSTNEGSPTRVSSDGSDGMPSTAKWVQKTPTHAVKVDKAAIDGCVQTVANSLGMGKRAAFLNMIGCKDDIEDKLQSLNCHSGKEYYGLQSQHAQILLDIRNLGIDLGAIQPPPGPETPRSAPASRVASDMLRSHITSASRRGWDFGEDVHQSCHTRNRHPALFGPHLVKGVVDIVSSPPTSKRASSPVDSTAADSEYQTAESEVTDPFEGKSGGVRLFEGMTK